MSLEPSMISRCSVHNGCVHWGRSANSDQQCFFPSLSTCEGYPPVCSTAASEMTGLKLDLIFIPVKSDRCLRKWVGCHSSKSTDGLVQPGGVAGSAKVEKALVVLEWRIFGPFVLVVIFDSASSSLAMISRISACSPALMA